MDNQKIELVSGITCKKIEPDIFRYEVPKDLNVTLSVIEELWEFGNSAYPIGKRKILAVFNSSFNPSKEAADFMAGLKRSEKIAAEAFVIDSVVLRLMTNVYLKLKKPIILSKTFDDERKALSWLKSV